MIDNTAAALEFVKKNGPVQPSQISTTINTNILFASAILSELTANKHVKITYIKRGGSPFYYVEGQEEKLMNLAEYLPSKVKEAYDLISEKLVIRDSTALPWQRVALRELKDFVVPLTVNYQGKQETFWKWYLTNNEDAKEIIKDLLNSVKEKEPENIKEEQAIESVKEEIKAPQKVIEEQKQLIEREEIKRTIVKDVDEKDYLEESLKQLAKMEMYVISQIIVRKGREFNFIVDVPSNMGQLRYFVKFKNKKLISDSDLTSALDEANKKNLPVLFLSNGTLNKKAQKYLDEHISGRLIYKAI